MQPGSGPLGLETHPSLYPGSLSLPPSSPPPSSGVRSLPGSTRPGPRAGRWRPGPGPGGSGAQLHPGAWSCLPSLLPPPQPLPLVLRYYSSAGLTLQGCGRPPLGIPQTRPRVSDSTWPHVGSPRAQMPWWAGHGLLLAGASVTIYGSRCSGSRGLSG